MSGLLRGELRLTLDILLGLTVGELILRLGLADRLMRRLMPFLRRHGIGPVLGTALTLSLGSSRAGAALLASALDAGKIDGPTALWGTLMLPFPGYLRRWPATFALALSMAGLAGGIFALFLILRSAARFLVALFILRGHGGEAGDAAAEAPDSRHSSGVWKKLPKTLPLAWFFFAVAYALVPWMDGFFKRYALSGGFLPLAGWTVAAGSLAHVSTALALAGGSLAARELTTAQAVFALILGSALGLSARVLRQNAGYYFGLFPAALARKMLFWNLGTILPLVLLSLFLSAIPLLWG